MSFRGAQNQVVLPPKPSSASRRVMSRRLAEDANQHLFDNEDRFSQEMIYLDSPEIPEKIAEIEREQSIRKQTEPPLPENKVIDISTYPGLDVRQLRDIITEQSAEYKGVYRFILTRKRSRAGHTKFCLGIPNNEKNPILFAKRKVATRSPYYQIGVREEDIGGDIRSRGIGYLGKLRGLSKTEYVLYDDGLNPEKHSLRLRKELLSVVFKPPKEKNERRQMLIGIPAPTTKETGGDAAIFCPKRDDPCGIALMHNRVMDSGSQNVMSQEALMCFQSIEADPCISTSVDPHGRETDLTAFHGRAHVPSVKNFQLQMSVPEDGFQIDRYLRSPAWKEIILKTPPMHSSIEPKNDIMDCGRVFLQLGKIDRDRFMLDFSAPLSIFQAFALILARFDTKL
eukprot:TRINITY_DN1698_c1_g1_i1.p1 TRINITY_DN1698_c1_g1~~TRINITY_DN1698_c1_g1_i1.p1  ORF type:complete len:397 (+),score=99.63 TRINITY_DN1698_c1_g1_i1:75-1265(+)